MVLKKEKVWMQFVSKYNKERQQEWREKWKKFSDESVKRTEQTKADEKAKDKTE